MKISKCPFCGSKHEITSVEHSSGYNRTGFLPEGAEFYRTTEQRTSRTGMVYKPIYYWRKMGYRIRCSNSDCIGFRLTRVYLKKKDAINAWNCRYLSSDTVVKSDAIDAIENYSNRSNSIAVKTAVKLINELSSDRRNKYENN